MEQMKIGINIIEKQYSIEGGQFLSHGLLERNTLKDSFGVGWNIIIL